MTDSQGQPTTVDVNRDSLMTLSVNLVSVLLYLLFKKAHSLQFILLVIVFFFALKEIAFFGVIYKMIEYIKLAL